MGSPSTSTRVKLLDAALDLLAEEGLQALSHRTVEKRAGASHGSTTYYFRTREALLAALLQHTAERDRQLVDDVLGGADLTVMDAAATRDLAGAGLAALLGDPHRRLAYYELFLYAARRPELQPELARWREAFVRIAEATLLGMGVAEPAATGRLLIATVDGIVLHLLSTPDEAMLAAAPDYLMTVLGALVAPRPTGGQSADR